MTMSSFSSASTSTTTITVELLEALLSPDGIQRTQAEAFLQSLSVEQRASNLLRCLQQQQQQQQHLQQQQQHLQQMAAVLLRRDILLLTDPSLLAPLTKALLELFLVASSSSSATATTTTTISGATTALGDCLAEICAVLSLIAPAESVTTMQGILQAISSAASQANPAVLRLLIALAERAPTTFCQTALPSLPELVGTILQQQQHPELLMELVVTGAQSLTHFAAEPNKNEPQQQQAMLQLLSKLSTMCLIPLLEQQLQQYASTTTTASSTTTTTILEHLVQAAEQVPALLYPAIQPLATFVCHVVAVAAAVQQQQQQQQSSSLMTAVQVLTSLVLQSSSSSYEESSSSRNYCPLPPPHNVLLTARQAFEQHLIPAMLQQLRQVVEQQDVDAWAAVAPTLQQQGTGDDIDDEEEDITYAQILLQDMLHTTCGSSTTTAGAATTTCLQTTVLPTVEQWMNNEKSTSSGNAAAAAAMLVLQCVVEALPVSFAPYRSIATQAALEACCSYQVDVRVQHHALVLLALLSEVNNNNNDGDDDDTVDASTTNMSGRVLEVMARCSHSPCPRVAATACLAMVSYCRGCFSDAAAADDTDNNHATRARVLPYVSDILAALTSGPLQVPVGASHHHHHTSTTESGVVVVQIRAMGVLAAVAKVCGPAFSPYYGSVMPSLMACCCCFRQQQPVVGPSSLHQIGAAVEAATVIMQALGDEQKHLFAADAGFLMQSMIPLLQKDVELDSYLLSAFARIASVLGEAYSPYVETVLPHLLQRATEPTDVEISEGNEQGLDASKRHQFDDEPGMESMTMAVPGRGLTKVTINTSKMQEKALAARAIYEHAVALDRLFGPYAKTCLDAFLPLIPFKYSAEIRSTSAQTLAAVFEAACAFGEDTGSMEVPQTYFPLVAKAIAAQIQQEDTIDMENIYALADSLSEIMCSVYMRKKSHGSVLLSQMNIDCANVIVQHCMRSMVSCLQRRLQITKRMSDGTTSEDEMEECQRQLLHEGELLTPLCDSVGYALKLFPEAFVPIFEKEVAPVLGTYLHSQEDIKAKFASICLFDDCVEHCGAAAAQTFAPVLAKAAVDGMDPATSGNDEDLIRASIYGIAQIARKAPRSVLEPYASTILHRLAAFVNSGPKSEADNIYIFENAVSALASLILFEQSPFRGSSFMKRETALKIFLASLPLREDEDEAKICHRGLCELVEHSWIQPSAECAQLVRVIGETLAFVADGEDIADDETVVRFTNILMLVQQQVPPEQVSRAFNELPGEAQAAINQAIQQHAHLSANVVSP